MAERSVLGPRDLAAEAVAGVLQRPARSALTTLGTVLGVGAFVAVLGLTSTATGQISRHFDALTETTVTVTDVGAAETSDGDPAVATGPQGHDAVSFPADADRRVGALNGAVAAGVYGSVRSGCGVRSAPGHGMWRCSSSPSPPPWAPWAD